eukprot:g644.t1
MATKRHRCYSRAADVASRRARGSTLSFLLVLMFLPALRGIGHRNVPKIDPKIEPRVVSTPYFYKSSKNEFNQPMALPSVPSNPYPSILSNAYSHFPDEPPAQDAPKYSDSSNNWPVRSSSLKGPQPPSRWMHTATLLQNKLIVWGGIATSDDALNDLWLFSYSDAEWTELERPMASDLPTYPNSGVGQSDHGDLELENIGRPASIPPPMPMRRAPGEVRETPPDPSSFSPQTMRYVTAGTPPALIPLKPEARSENDAMLTVAELEPEARWMHTAVVNSKDDVPSMVIFGGCSNSFKLLNDVWEYKYPSSWTKVWEDPDGSKVEAKKGPTAREGHAAALGVASFSSSALQEMYVFGGINLTFVPNSDMWKYDIGKKTWEHVVPSGELVPPARWMHTMVGTKGGTELVIFGGCSSVSGPLDDTWLYSVKDKTWELLTHEETYPPPARWLHSAVPLISGSSEPYAEFVVIFGGAANNVLMDDMWFFHVDDRVWIEDYAASDAPMARDGHTMTLVASPQMRDSIKAAEKARSTGRRLLNAFPFTQGTMYTNNDRENQDKGLAPPWAPPLPKIDKSDDTKAEDFVANERSSTENFWLVVFGGRAERGLALSARANVALY